MRILLTNDDGVFAAGIKILRETLVPHHEVWVAAPLSEMSAVSHAITLRTPLRVSEISPQVYGVSSTPTDAIFWAIFHLLPQPPDLVLSGINKGPNLGDDVTYSGTVGGAMEGCLRGCRSIAVSLCSLNSEAFQAGANFIRDHLETLVRLDLPEKTFLNINIPNLPGPLNQIRFTRLGNQKYQETVLERQDIKGRKYYWIGGPQVEAHEPAIDTDTWAIQKGYVSITPVTLDLTDYPTLKSLQSLSL